MGLFDKIFGKEKATSEDVISAMIVTAGAAMDNGDYARAVETYKHILRLTPNGTAQYNLGSLYALVAAFWCVGAIIGWKAVRGIWNRVLYGSCFLVLATQVLGPLLEQLGVIIWPIPILFSDVDWLYWIVCVMPPFAAMAFLLAEQKTNYETYT